jgi:hypothetical protein
MESELVDFAPRRLFHRFLSEGWVDKFDAISTSGGQNV